MAVLYFVRGRSVSHNIHIIMLGHHSLDGQTWRWVLFNTIITDLEQVVDCYCIKFADDSRFGGTILT